MASATELLRLIVDADGKGAIAEFDKVGASASKNLGKTDEKLAAVGASMTRYGVAVAAGGVAAGVGLFKLAQMSEEAEQQSRKLDNSIANSNSTFAKNGFSLAFRSESLSQALMISLLISAGTSSTATSLYACQEGPGTVRD